LSYVFKNNSVLVSDLSVIADCFSYAAFWVLFYLINLAVITEAKKQKLTPIRQLLQHQA